MVSDYINRPRAYVRPGAVVTPQADFTLVDDLTALVDDPVALVGIQLRLDVPPVTRAYNGARVIIQTNNDRPRITI